MDLAKKIESLLLPSFERAGIDIVCVHILHLNTGINLQILIERANGDSVSIDDCIFCNRTASALLDVENLIEKGYNLEVSSPGEFRPLTKIRDFRRFLGKVVKVELLAPIDGLRKFRGTIEKVDDIDENDANINFVELEGKEQDFSICVKFSDIKKATFKKVFEIN